MDQPFTARTQVRQAVAAALRSANLGATIDSPGDRDTPPTKLPAILMRSAGDRKESLMRGPPEFTTTVSIEIEARVEAERPEDAQDLLEGLCYAIECAVLTNYALTVLIQQVSSVDTKLEITSDGRRHLGGAFMTFAFEVVEVFDPLTQSPVQPVAVPLQEIQLHNDMVGTFDATGTYANSAFPGAAKPAPRTSGPDGRDEGALDIFPPQ
jgi:hypothetical protein